MRRDRSSADFDDDDFDEFDWHNPADDERDADDDSSETECCPHCGADIYEDAVQCPACGQYITFDTSVWSGRPWWWILLGLLGIVSLIFTLLLIF